MKRNLNVILIKVIDIFGDRSKEKIQSAINKSLNGNFSIVVRDLIA